MNLSALYKSYKTYIFISLLFLSVTALFLTAWNSYIRQGGSLLLPLVFLISSYILIILLGVNLQPSVEPELKSQIKEENEVPSARRTMPPENTPLTGSTALISRITDRTRKGGVREKAHGILQNLAREFSIMQGVFYLFSPATGKFSMLDTYAFSGDKKPEPFEPGMGIHGQAALDKKLLELTNLPGNYTLVKSGLGSAYGKYLYLLPFTYKNETIALAEFTVFNPIREDYKNTLRNGLEELGEKWKQLMKDADRSE